MTTSIRLPEELEKKLTALSKITGKKKSSLIIEALTEYMNDLDDYYAVSKRMQDYDSAESLSLHDIKALCKWKNPSSPTW